MPILAEHDLPLKSVQYRQALLRLIKRTGAGHIGGDLSCLDVLNVLYNRILRVSPETFKSPEHDYYIQSKGHCAEDVARWYLGCPTTTNLAGRWLNWRRRKPQWHNGTGAS